MLGNLRNRFLSLQEDITSSVRQFAPTQPEVVEACEENQGVNPYAGGNLLEAWQVKWEELHRSHDRNARKAAKCDNIIMHSKQNVEQQWRSIMTLQALGKIFLYYPKI